MDKGYAKIEGVAGLVRDLNTDAVLSASKDEFKQFKSRKNRELAMLRRIEELEARIERLEGSLSILIRNALASQDVF